ncbi:hypothetical protein QIW46_00650 [Pseudomonas fluorescens]|jgi:hypothetical protein|uniref:hypothetical protein n=1 Tax=Pseudomonas TaxID=286 RepID=UPI001BAF8DDF|nr:hypothetical protein [Pseudomonas sp. SCA2728.1_7]QUE91575.1 hypothetical protein KBP52_03790 [Pseudomonas sp. SCA2728.1_7]
MENNDGKKIADSKIGIGNELTVFLNNEGMRTTKAPSYKGTLEGTDSYGLTIKEVVNMKPVSVYVKYDHIACIFNKDDIDRIELPIVPAGRSCINDDDNFKLPRDNLVDIGILPNGGLIDDIKSEH